MRMGGGGGSGLLWRRVWELVVVVVGVGGTKVLVVLEQRWKKVRVAWKAEQRGRRRRSSSRGLERRRRRRGEMGSSSTEGWVELRELGMMMG